MNLEQTEAPAETPVSLTEVKAHLRISNTASDTYLGLLIDAASQYLDGRFGYLRRALVTQTWVLSLPEWPGERCLELPLPPLQSVTHVKYYDISNTLQTLATDQYRVVANEFIGRIEQTETATWPTTYDRPDAVQVTFVAGFGDAADVPAPIKQALFLLIGDMWANRGDAEGIKASETQRRLLAPYLVRDVA